MTTTAADARYETAAAIAALLPGAIARNMPALGFASTTWRPDCGGVVTVMVKMSGPGLADTSISVEMLGIPDEAITAAVQAIAKVQVTQRQAVPA